MTKRKQPENKIIPEKESQVPKTEHSEVHKHEPEKTDHRPCGDETESYKQQIADAQDKYLRLYSEFDNYRKRTIRERAEMLQTASSGLMTQLLPVLDDFERALSSMENAADISAVKEGVVLIHNKFRKILEQKGLEEMKPVGEPFCTDFHEAITSIPADDDSMKGKVIDVIEKGYLLNGKVIRFARVAVGQ
jgi:molecular chaperone GrpE